MAASAFTASPVVTDTLLGNLNNGKVVVSEMGATIPGINAANSSQYIFELVSAVVEGSLELDKFFIGWDAAGIQQDLSADLAQIFWVHSIQHEQRAENMERLADLVRSAMVKQKVSKKQLLETQEVELLEAAGIVASADAFKKRETRQHTATVYKQAKYNMMREESEGYAKLLTLFNSSPPSAATLPALISELKLLIGSFDLDPNRVFDLLLDAAERHPEQRDWLQLVPMFNDMAPPEMMGFKFMGHQREGVAPAGISLYEVVAMLVQAGYMTVEQILSYLTPSDEEAQKAQADALALVRAKVDAIGRLDLAAPAADRPANEPRRVGLGGGLLDLDAAQYDQELAALGGSRAQKLRLVEGFLRIQDWDHAELLMRWLQTLNIQAVSDRALCATLTAALAARIQPTYDAMYPSGPLAGSILDAAALQRSSTATPAGVVPGPPLDDRVFDMLGFLRLYLYRDVVLFAKVVRVLRHHVVFYGKPANETEEAAAAARAEAAKVERAISSAIMPALMMVPANPAMVAEVWALLSLLPYSRRYELYQEVLAEAERQPLMAAAARMAAVEVKKVFRRIHMPADRRDRKEALKPYGRVLAKIMHANPLSVSLEIVRMAMGYASQIEPLVEALRYLTPMAYDVLTFVILLQLGNRGRKKLKDDGVNVQEWLQALAQFTGSVCKKCPGMEINAICQYVADSVRAGDSFDLLVLKELVGQMTGVQLVADVSADKVNDLAGGETLRQESLAAGGGLTNKSLQRGGRRLLEALQKGSARHHLAMPLLILISQQLDKIAIETESPHLKLIAELYDKCHEACLQYLEFLRGVLPLEQYAAVLLPLDELSTRYGMRPEVALTLWRPVMVALEHQAKSMAEEGELSDEDASAAGGNAGGATAAGAGGDAMVVDEKEDGEAPPPPPPLSQAAANGGPALSITWSSMLASVRKCQPELWDSINPELYATFWNLSLPDIYFPKDRYDSLMDRLKREAQEYDSKARMARDELEANQRQWAAFQRGMGMRPMDVIDPHAAQDAADGFKRERARVQETIERLQAECEAQRKRTGEVQARLERECGTWLPSLGNRRAIAVNAVTAFIQHLVVPRVLLSPADALFCARFALKLHQLCTPRWSAPLYYDRVARNIVNLLVSSTDREAVCLGIFLAETLELVGRWRASEQVYKAEAESKSTFCVSWEPGKDGPKTSFFQFQQLMYKWQMKMTKVFVLLLNSGEYVQIRNALLVMSKLVHVFPALEAAAATISRTVAGVVAKETREDLKLMAQRYEASLAKEREKPGRMFTKEEYGGEPANLKRKVAGTAGDAKSAAKPAATTTAPKPGAATAKPAGAGLPKPPAAASGRAAAGGNLRPDAPAFSPVAPGPPPPPPGRPRPRDTAASGAAVANGDVPPAKRARTSEKEPGEVSQSPSRRSPLASPDERSHKESRPAAAPAAARDARATSSTAAGTKEEPQQQPARRRDDGSAAASSSRPDAAASKGNGTARGGDAEPSAKAEAGGRGEAAGGDGSAAGAKRKREEGPAAAAAGAASPIAEGAKQRGSTAAAGPRERGTEREPAKERDREERRGNDAAAGSKEDKPAARDAAAAKEERPAAGERSREREERRAEAPAAAKEERPGVKDERAAARDEAEKRRARAERFQLLQSPAADGDKGGAKMERASSKSLAKDEQRAASKEDKAREAADREERRSEGTPAASRDKSREREEGKEGAGSKEKRKDKRHDKRSHKDKDKEKDKEKEKERGSKSGKDKDREKDRGDKHGRDEAAREESEPKRRRTAEPEAAAAAAPARSTRGSGGDAATAARASSATAPAERGEPPARTGSGSSKHAPIAFPSERLLLPPPPPPRDDQRGSRHGSRRK